MSRKTKEAVVEEFRCASIQDAAMRVIARKGLEETTVQDVAEEAGVAKGTVYVYFRDREELLGRTVDRLYDTLLEELEPVFATPSPLGERLTALALRQLGFFDRHRALFRATLTLTQQVRETQKGHSRCFSRYMDRLEKLFGDAARAGELREGLDARQVAAVYRDVLRGLILRRLDPKSTRSRTSAEGDARFIVSVLLRGIQSGDER